VLADAERGDWILCQVTSKAYADPLAIELTNADFQTGSLHLTSYARPGKIFTANESLLVAEVGKLNDETFKRVIDAVVGLLQASLRP
jgi:mRNA interferase MazF